jgi:prepilin-type processing-associated H-X9-DG protein
MGLVFKIYSNEAAGQRWPTLAERADLWTFEPRTIYPEYLTDLTLLRCPSRASINDIVAELSRVLKQNYSQLAEFAAKDYVYLGWVVHDESDVQALAELRSNPDFNRGADEAVVGGRTLYRLREGVDKRFVADPNNLAEIAKAQSEIPVMFEVGYNHEERSKNVLYMDGHVERLRHGRFPVTDAVNEALGLPKAPAKSWWPWGTSKH